MLTARPLPQTCLEMLYLWLSFEERRQGRLQSLDPYREQRIRQHFAVMYGSNPYRVYEDLRERGILDAEGHLQKADSIRLTALHLKIVLSAFR